VVARKIGEWKCGKCGKTINIYQDEEPAPTQPDTMPPVPPDCPECKIMMEYDQFAHSGHGPFSQGLPRKF